jgi:hypothetical protein
LELDIQPQNFPAHPLVLLNQRQIAHSHEQQNGKYDQADDHFRQLAPDAKVHVHHGELSTRAPPAKADFTG